MNNRINFSKIKNDELFNYSSKVLNEVEESGIEFPEFKAIQVKLRKALDRIAVSQEGFSLDSKSTKVQKMNEKRKNSFHALRDISFLSRFSNNVEWQKASVLLTKLFENHGTSMYRSDLNTFSNRLSNLLQEIEFSDNYKAALKTIRATHWFDQLKNDNEAFIATLAKRLNTRQTNKRLDDSRVAIKFALESLYLFLDYQSLFGKDAYVLSFADRVDPITKTTNNTISFRLKVEETKKKQEKALEKKHELELQIDSA